MGKAAIRECIECGELRPHCSHGRCISCYRKRRYRTDPEYRRKSIDAAGVWNKAHPAKHATHERARRERLGDEYRKRERQRDRSEWRSQYYQTHKAYFAQKQREYRQRHPDKAEARWDKWYRENPAKVVLKNQMGDQRRLARQHKVPHTLTGDQWRAIKAAYRNRCAYCGKPSQRLTQDHVIPLSKGGGYVAENIVPACRSCNSRKNNRKPLKEVPIRLLL